MMLRTGFFYPHFQPMFIIFFSFFFCVYTFQTFFSMFFFFPFVNSSVGEGRSAKENNTGG